MTTRVTVLLSGAGTTLESLISQQKKGALDVEFNAVVSSKPSAFGLERARRHGIPTHVANRAAYRDAAAFSNAVHRLLDEDPPDLIVLAGFLSLVEVRQYRGRMMNTHPSLIPAFCGPGFYGERVYRAVLEAGVKLTGVTIHFCDDTYDTGPIILQRPVVVGEDDDVQSLQRRVTDVEKIAYADAIRLFSEGRLRVEGNRVRISPA